MPASGKQIEANRANATKSTGPRTAEGKRRSKMNAVVHGLTAQSSLLPGEDREELERLSRDLLRQLSPRGVVQRLMAERIVSLAWKLRRVARAEEAIAREMEEGAARSWEHERAINEATGGQLFAGLGPPPRRRTAGALLADSFGTRDGGLVRVTEYELKLDAALRAGMRELRAIQKEEPFGGPEELEGQVEPEETQPPQPAPAPNEPNSAAPEEAEEVWATPTAATGAAPTAAAAGAPAAPVDETNPIGGDGESPQGEGFSGVTPNDRDRSRSDSRTSAPPPPG